MHSTLAIKPSSDVRVLQVLHAVLEGAVLVEATVGLDVSVQGGLPPVRRVVVAGGRGQVRRRGGEVFFPIPVVLPLVLLQHHGQMVDVNATAVALVEELEVHLLLLLFLLLRCRLAVHRIVVKGVVVVAVRKKSTVKMVQTSRNVEKSVRIVLLLSCRLSRVL